MPSHIGREELAQLLDIAPASVNRLVRQGVLVQDDNGYPVAGNAQAYGAHVIEIERRKAAGTSAGRALVARKVEALEARLAREGAGLISMDETLESVDELAAMLSDALGQLAERDDLPNGGRKIIEEARQRFDAAVAQRRELFRTGRDEEFSDDE